MSKIIIFLPDQTHYEVKKLENPKSLPFGTYIYRRYESMGIDEWFLIQDAHAWVRTVKSENVPQWIQMTMLILK